MGLCGLKNFYTHASLYDFQCNNFTGGGIGEASILSHFRDVLTESERLNVLPKVTRYMVLLVFNEHVF